MQQVLTNTKVSEVFVNGIYNYAQQTKTNVFTRLLSWCETQEHNRLLWMALSFGGLIVFVIPCTAIPYLLLGVNNLNLWILVCIINVPIISLNLAAQSTKLILPALFISWALDAIIILSYLGVFLL
ncbi:MAG: hypothetical protein ABIR81_01160 [Ginsengibacter sp.]